MPRDDGPELREIATLVALHGMLSCHGASERVANEAIAIGRQVAEGLEPRVSGNTTGAAWPAGVYTEERIRMFKEQFKVQLRARGLDEDRVMAEWRAAWELTA